MRAGVPWNATSGGRVRRRRRMSGHGSGRTSGSGRGCRIDRSVPAITLVLELVEAGRTLGEIAAIRGVQPASVIKVLERNERLDVIRQLTGVVV